jgi:hypothetical protein
LFLERQLVLVRLWLILTECVNIGLMAKGTSNISWEADEHVVREKRAGWYVGLVAVSLAFVAGSVLLQWWTFTALIVVSVAALVIYTVRPPRKLQYSLSSKGLSEGNKLHEFSQFRAFGVLNEGADFFIVLLPKKRFAGRVIVFFPESQGEDIVDMFGARLPMEEVKMDMLDKAIRFLRI